MSDSDEQIVDMRTGDVHVTDLIVVLERPRADFGPADEHVLESSTVPVFSDASNESIKVVI